jgi:hypothetical protein
MANEAKRDFPASREPFGGLLDKGPGKETPKKKLPADKKSVNQSLANLEKLTGFTPPTEADQEPLPPVRIFVGHDPRPATMPDQPKKTPETPQNPHEEKTDFLDLVPAVAPKEKPKLKGGKPITPPWHGDPEPAIAITTDLKKRRRAHGSDAGHDDTVHRQQWRQDNHLPPNAPTWKKLLPTFSTLKPDQIEYLKQSKFHPERFKQPNMKNPRIKDLIELMLFRLKQAGKL